MLAPWPESAVPLTLAFPHARWSASWRMTLLTVLAILACLDLGRWQWHRAQYKRALAVAFSAGSASPEDLGARSASELPRYTRVRVQGRYDGAHQFLLDNLSHQGRAGYEVLTPLELADGRTLLVNRGWVPLGASRRQLPDISIDAPVSQTVAGRLDALPVAGIALGHVSPDAHAAWPRLTSFPTMADLSASLGRPLEGRQLLLDSGEPLGYLRDWHPGGIGPTRHLAYALQWWGFATLSLLLYLRLNWRRVPA